MCTLGHTCQYANGDSFEGLFVNDRREGYGVYRVILKADRGVGVVVGEGEGREGDTLHISCLF